MSSREEILRLMNRYGFTIDTGDLDGQCHLTVFQQTTDLPLQAIFSGHHFDGRGCPWPLSGDSLQLPRWSPAAACGGPGTR